MDMNRILQLPLTYTCFLKLCQNFEVRQTTGIYQSTRATLELIRAQLKTFSNHVFFST